MRVARADGAAASGNLKQLFASGQEFTYSISDIARYYRTYLDLMQHWDEVLPGKVLRVWHEEVVEDLEGNVRRILDFCGLPFGAGVPGVLQGTSGSVRTASLGAGAPADLSANVLHQWRHHESWLELPQGGASATR